VILRDRNSALTSFPFDHKYRFAFLKRGQPGNFLPGISVPFDFHPGISRFFGPSNGSHFGNLTIFGFSGKFPRNFHLRPFQKFPNFLVEWKAPLLSDCSLKYTHAKPKFSLREDFIYRKKRRLIATLLCLAKAWMR